MRAFIILALVVLVGCATTESVTSFVSKTDLTRLATAACAGHQGVDSVKLQLTYALVNCRDGALVTVEYFPAPAPAPVPPPKEEVK